MNKNHMLAAGLIIVVVAGAAFWSGMTYAASTTASRGQFAPGSFSGAAGRGFRGAAGAGSVAVFGAIIARDATSITVQLGGLNATSTLSTGSTGSPQADSGQANGNQTGTKIVLLNDATEVGKMVRGTMSDLSKGQMVLVSGTQNSDGSVTADTIQIRQANFPSRAQ